MRRLESRTHGNDLKDTRKISHSCADRERGCAMTPFYTALAVLEAVVILGGAVWFVADLITVELNQRSSSSEAPSCE